LELVPFTADVATRSLLRIKKADDRWSPRFHAATHEVNSGIAHAGSMAFEFNLRQRNKRQVVAPYAGR
jgi:hypothetical protein